MKLNNKYRYFEVEKEPKTEDFPSPSMFTKAYSAYTTSKKLGGAFSGNDLLKERLIKTREVRIERNEIKVGNTVNIERWDGNGIPGKVMITELEISLDKVLVRCDKGWFVFSRDNCKKDNIDFNWTAKGKEWEKKYKKWVDGNKYYFKQ